VTQIPRGWRQTTLGEIGSYLNGRAFKKSEWRDSGRPIIRIQNLTGSSRTFNYFVGDVDDRYVARPGDLLVSWAATLGAYLWAGPEALVNQHIFKVESRIDTKFHKYLLDHKLAELAQHTHGSGMVHITRAKFDSVPVVVPEVTEQRRIVEILEDHLSRIEAARRPLKELERRTVAVEESWLRRLTQYPPSEETTVGGVIVSCRGGWSRSAKHLVGPDEGVAYLKMHNITRRGALALQDLAHVRATPEEHGKYRVMSGDILFNSKNSGDLIGKTTMADRTVEGATFNENIMRLRFNEMVVPAFAALWFLGPVMRRHITEAASASTNVAAVYQGQLLEMPMWLPEVDRQLALVNGFTYVREAAARLAEAGRREQVRACSLRQAILAAAFEGKLTGRHMDDEIIEEAAQANSDAPVGAG
jgi:type I restriction enzyme S subunit